MAPFERHGVEEQCLAGSPPPTLVAAPRGPARKTTQLPPWRMHKVTKHIEQHLDRRLTLAELASLAGLSASHFSRAFRNALNTTPQHFVRQRRIERAKMMLTCPKRRLAHIAQECGFSDQAHFTRVFRHFVGEPPSRWRGETPHPPPIE